MQINLARWLKTPELPSTGMLISASEDASVIVDAMLEQIRHLAGDCHLQSYAADRYFDFNLLVDILQSGSLFSTRNLLVVSFKTKPTIEQQKQLAVIYPLLNQDNILVLITGKLDKRELSATWVQEFAATRTLSVISAEGDEISSWCNYLLTKDGFTIDPAALEALIGLNQNNLSQLKQELARLMLLLADIRQIRLADIEKHVLDNSNYSVYTLSNAYLSGDLALVAKIFDSLCTSSEDVILLSWNIAEDLRKLIKIKNLSKQESNFRTIASQLRIWGESITAFNRAHQRLSYQQLLDYFAEIAAIDRAVKGVLDDDPVLRLKQLVFNLTK